MFLFSALAIHALGLGNAALTAASPRCCEPLTSATFMNARGADETSRSESCDPVCRPIRLSLFRLSFHLPALPTSGRDAPL